MLYCGFSFLDFYIFSLIHYPELSKKLYFSMSPQTSCATNSNPETSKTLATSFMLGILQCNQNSASCLKFEFCTTFRLAGPWQIPSLLQEIIASPFSPLLSESPTQGRLKAHQKLSLRLLSVWCPSSESLFPLLSFLFYLSCVYTDRK